MVIQSVYKQLQALAERGSPGERDLAARKLKEFEAKYANLQLKEGDTVSTHWFRWKNQNENKLLNQICYKVLDDPKTYIRRIPGCRSTKEIGANCTDAEATLIEYLFSFYRELYASEVELLFQAFIQKHQIFGKTPITAPEDREPHPDADRLFRMMNTLKNASPYSALPEKTD